MKPNDAAVSELWAKHDVAGLLTLSDELKSNGTHGESLIVRGLAYSIQGDYHAALNLYDQSDAQSSSKRCFFLKEIDKAYVLTKLNRRAKNRPLGDKLFTLAWLFFRGGELRSTLIHHQLYSWYISAFWSNHAESLFAALLLMIFSVITRNVEARTHAGFLLGHLANVKGLPAIGVPMVRNSFQKRRFIRPWLRTCFLSYMAYGLYVVGREELMARQILDEACLALEKHPDPFYRILFLVTKLRFFSQLGDVDKAEPVAAELLKLSEVSQNKRFYFSAKANLALCYGIRGLLWKCSAILEELSQYTPGKPDPVELGSFYLLRGWAHFFTGNYRNALADSELALTFFATTRSFYLAMEMSRILNFLSKFRIQLEELHLLDERVALMKKHSKMLSRLASRYRLNSVLFLMINEEMRHVGESLSKLCQPGYSRDKNLFVCERNLFNSVGAVVNASKDELAWREIAKAISPVAELEFVFIESLDKCPDFQVRSGWKAEDPIELIIQRKFDTHSRWDLLTIKVLGNPVSSLADIVKTLHPLFDCLFMIRDQKSQLMKSEKDKALGVLAAQVSHDIRSPLAALDAVSWTIKDIADDQKYLLKTSITRISDIAENLLNAYRSHSSDLPLEDSAASQSRVVLLTALISPIISEKRAALRSSKSRVSIDMAVATDEMELFSHINESFFQRALSNVLNNAIEAIELKGEVKLFIKRHDDMIHIEVVDSGCGLTPEEINTILSKQTSLNKFAGLGLGLAQVKTFLTSCGGDLWISSEKDFGTKVTLAIPAVPCPKWIMKYLDLADVKEVMIVDDDESIHGLWERRFKKADVTVPLRHFFTPEEVETFLSMPHEQKSLWLVDYNFAQSSTSGIDLINRIGPKRSCLVTSYFQDRDVIREVQKINARLLPKNLVASVGLTMGRQVDRQAHYGETLAMH